MSGATSGESGPPGVPLPSGFDYRPVSEHPELTLSKEARERVLRVMDDSERCRARAAIAAQTYVICGGHSVSSGERTAQGELP